MPIFEEQISQNEMIRQQQQLEARLNRKAASEMIEFISPGIAPETAPSQTKSQEYTPQDFFEGGDLWEGDDIKRAEAKAFARECIQKGRDKFRSFKTRIINGILRRVPFGESIKSALRGRA